MTDTPDTFREQLLAQFEPGREKLATYRNEVQAMLAQHEQSLRRQHWYAGTAWVFVVLLGTTFLVLSGLRGDPAFAAWMGVQAIFFLIGPAVELLKYFLNRQRVELLKELKGLEWQLLEIKEQLRHRPEMRGDPQL